jgi:hypothetical protein
LKVEPILTTSQKASEEDGVAEQASAQMFKTLSAAEHSGWVDGDSVKDPAKVIVMVSASVPERILTDIWYNSQ